MWLIISNSGESQGSANGSEGKDGDFFGVLTTFTEDLNIVGP